MNADQARALFLEHCEPGDLSHYGEKAAVAAILAATVKLSTALEMIAFEQIKHPRRFGAAKEYVAIARAAIAKATAA